VSTKKPNEMQSIFRALQVNQPLRLRKSGPGLCAPTEVNEKEDPQKDAARRERAQIAHASPELAQTEVPQNESTSSPAGVENRPVLSPGNDLARKEVPQSQHTENAHTQKEFARTEHTKKECPQNEVAVEVSSEGCDPDTDTRTESYSGFFRLSHSIFSESTMRDLSGDSFRLFLWMSARAWRYPDSTGVIRASVRYVEGQTGMGHATISRAFKTLKELQLVKSIEVNYKRGNLWQVSSLALADGGAPNPGLGKKRASNENKQSEVHRDGREAASKRARSRLQTSEQRSQIEDHFKKYKNIQKHSQETLRPFLDRIDAIGAPRKRASELSNLDELLDCFPADQVISALEDVEQKGTLKGEKCHSPFSYLSLTIDAVLKRRQSAPRSLKLVTSVTDLLEIDDRPEQVNRNQIESFETLLPPESQELFVKRFAQAEFPHGFLPPASIVRRLAAAAWFSRGDHKPLETSKCN
jgi:hypothetical protein